jgi:hypothetical protein
MPVVTRSQAKNARYANVNTNTPAPVADTKPKASTKPKKESNAEKRGEHYAEFVAIMRECAFNTAFRSVASSAERIRVFYESAVEARPYVKKAIEHVVACKKQNMYLLIGNVYNTFNRCVKDMVKMEENRHGIAELLKTQMCLDFDTVTKEMREFTQHIFDILNEHTVVLACNQAIDIILVDADKKERICIYVQKQ